MQCTINLGQLGRWARAPGASGRVRMLGSVAVLATCCADANDHQTGGSDEALGKLEQALQEERPTIEGPPERQDSFPIEPVGCRDHNMQCFGAMGSNCTGLVPNEWGSLFQLEGVANLGCSGGECFISNGSWLHDECCVSEPGGHMCNGVATLTSSLCLAEWITAGHRAAHGLAWKRDVDMCRVDDDGRVDFAEYCAPNGSIVASGDVARCCGRSSRTYDAGRDIAQAMAQFVSFDNSFTPRVCTGASSAPAAGTSNSGTAAPPTRPLPAACLTNAQCHAGEELCLPDSPGSRQKHCVAI